MIAMLQAISELSKSPARADANKVIILMTDGGPNGMESLPAALSSWCQSRGLSISSREDMVVCVSKYGTMLLYNVDDGLFLFESTRVQYRCQKKVGSLYSSTSIFLFFCLFSFLFEFSSIHHRAHHTRKHLRHLFLHVSRIRRTASFGGHRGHGRGECRWVQWCGFGRTFQRSGEPG